VSGRWRGRAEDAADSPDNHRGSWKVSDPVRLRLSQRHRQQRRDGVPPGLQAGKDPVPALGAPALSHQLQQGFWSGAQAGVAPRGAPGEPLQMGGLEGCAVAGADSRLLPRLLEELMATLRAGE
jgi:hypothetical protein